MNTKALCCLSWLVFRETVNLGMFVFGAPMYEPLVHPDAQVRLAELWRWT